MPRLGQHFLKDRSILGKIVEALALAKDDIVVEIGPGHGELTAAFGQPPKARTIIAIEKDPGLVQLLKGKFPSIEMLEGDALKILPKLIGGERLRDKRWKLTGNIPYYITGKLLRTMGEFEHKPERSVLMVQREVAERLCAAPPTMNRLAASVQFWADASIVAHVPKKDFRPPPEVDSAVILLKIKRMMPSIEPERYYETVRVLFAQPRKTILNNLFEAKEKQKKEEIAETLHKIGILPDNRPQDLSVQDIIAIASA